MKTTTHTLVLFLLFFSEAAFSASFPSIETAQTSNAVFIGTLIFVPTTYGNDRALLCDGTKEIEKDYSTCINLLGNIKQNESGAVKCIEIKGTYTPYSSGLIYLGSVGKEFGQFTVVHSKVRNGC